MPRVTPSTVDWTTMPVTVPAVTAPNGL